MIIDFTLDCKNYFQNVFERKMPLDLGHSPYRCAECGARRMTRHGTYERYAVLFNESGMMETFPLRVQRLRCICGRTHALLPGDVISFHNYNYVPVIDLILLCLYSLGEPCSTMTKKLEDLMLSYQTLRHLLSVYRIYEKGSFLSSGSAAGMSSAAHRPPPLSSGYSTGWPHQLSRGNISACSAGRCS